MEDHVTSAAMRLSELRHSVERARLRFTPLQERVELVAVSKTFGAEAIEPFLGAGQRVFGENRVQEAKEKWPALKAAYPDVVLHLIGPLQTNKLKDALALFDVIETLDRERLAEALAAEKAKGAAMPKLFVQVNIGLEEQKSGIAPAEAMAFVARCRDVHGLSIAGLMCIPPADDAPAPYFAQMLGLAKGAGVAELSMGMSGDYEIAIGMGATQVRVGSALFGHR
jgi:pyridoxal phosphate enzyme (YggS family)